MALAPLSLRDAAIQSAPAKSLPPSDYPLHLLLAPPRRHSARGWLAIAGATVLVHLLVFAIAVSLPSVVERSEPERRIVEHHTPLYLPPDVMTQKAPNRQKISKQIDLAALLAERQAQQAQRPAPAPSVKHFELPQQQLPQTAKTAPKILPDAPNMALNQPPGPPPVGAANGLPSAPPPPNANPSPFENVGSEVPPNPHPTLAPPKSTVQALVNQLAHGANQHVAVTDENQTQPAPAVPGMVAMPGAQHAAIELKSDPLGTDFKPYLTRILAIVRANWKHVIPESVRMGTLRGRTVVEFIINRDGSIPKLVTAESSGLDPLDRAAIAGLSMSNPLPPLPADFKGAQIRLAFSFAYNMPSQ